MPLPICGPAPQRHEQIVPNDVVSVMANTGQALCGWLLGLANAQTNALNLVVQKADSPCNLGRFTNSALAHQRTKLLPTARERSITLRCRLALAAFQKQQRGISSQRPRRAQRL